MDAESRQPRPIAHSHGHDLLLLLLSLVGTFGFAGVTAAVVWKFLPSSATAANLSSADAAPLDLIAYARGQKLYASSCITCHGPSATGAPRLGKDLLRSRMVLRSSDHELISFIKAGRSATDPDNTTGIPMLPKGGNAALTDKDLAEIVVYLRGLQHPLRVPAGDAPTEALADLVAPAPPAAPQPVASPAPAAPPSVAAGPGTPDPESITRGKKVYMSCMACHGKDATGVKGMGKDLTQSELVSSKTDDQLIEFIKKGRLPNDPGNTTKVAMPPKGGNPALNDKQLRDVVAYLRSLQPAAAKK